MKFIRKKILFFAHKIGRVDKLTVIRHGILFLYGYFLSPVLLGIFDETLAIIFMFVFQIVNISIFLKISKRDEKEGLILWVVSLVFKNRKTVKLVFLSVTEPFLSVFEYIRNEQYVANKKIKIMLLLIACSLLSSITWAILIYYTGLSGWIWERLVNLF